MSKKGRKLAKPKKLAAKVDPVDPERRGSILTLPTRTAGVVVNEDTALTQSAVWACQRVISETLAGMPWMTARVHEDWTYEPIRHEGNDWLLNHESNPEVNAFCWRDFMLGCAVIWGNGLSEIERDFTGNPVRLWQIEPWRVCLERDDAGRLWYKVQNYQSEPTYLPPRDVFHLKGPSPDALWGWSVIRMHARTIGLAIAQEQSAATFNENDSTPGGFIEHPARLSEQARQNLIQSWERRHAGSRNKRRVAVLEEGMKWQQTGLPPDDAKLIEQMQLTPSMICRIFRVPPHKIADLTHATYSNIEQQEIEFVKDTLRPWAERMEAEADVKLFGRNNQGTLATAIRMKERERGDTAAQTNHVEKMVFHGVYSINEGRNYLDLPSIGTEGDRRFVQSAMIPLEMAGKEQANASEPADNAPESDDEPLSTSPTFDELEAELLPAVEDACQRMMKYEKDAEHLSGDELGRWLAKHREVCKKLLTLHVRPLAKLYTSRVGLVTDTAVSLFLTQHFQNSTDREPAAKCRQLREYVLAAAKGAA